MTKRIIIAILALCASAFGTTRYIATSAGVFSGGTACNGQTAITPATWNGITNAGDDIIWICGTLTGSSGATMFTPLGNGSSGHPITINWDTGSILTAPYWSTTTAAINMTSRSWYVFDGKGTGNPAQLATGGNPSGGGLGGGANGIIQCTANGTSLANQQDSLMVLADSSSHLTFQNLWFKNNYVRVANTSGGTGFNSTIITATNATDILVTHNWATNARTLLGDAFTANGQNFEASFNYTFAVEVPLALATVSASVTWTSALTHDNHWAGGVDQWDDPVSNSFHHDGCCHFFAQASGAHINGWRNYNNLTDGIWGNDNAYFISSGGTHITAYVYPEQTGGDFTDFNNIYDTQAGTPKLTASDNGSIFCKCSTSTGMSCAIYNDTFIGQAANSTYNIDLETDATASCFIAKNNIHINQGGPYYLGGGASSTITSRNNDFFGQGSSNWNLGTFAQWQTAGQDAAPAVNGSDPKVNTSTYLLGSGSSAIGIGANLTSLGIAALDVDKAGVARPGGATAWDAGAYQFGSSPVAPTVTTTMATNVLVTTATAGGIVSSNGGASVTAEGTACGATANPTTPCTSDGTATPFNSSLTGLNPSSLYHYRAYATNSVGTGYGSDLTFTTQAPCGPPAYASPCSINSSSAINYSPSSFPNWGSNICNTTDIYHVEQCGNMIGAGIAQTPTDFNTTLIRCTDLNTTGVPSDVWETFDDPYINIWNTNHTAFLAKKQAEYLHMFTWDGAHCTLATGFSINGNASWSHSNPNTLYTITTTPAVGTITNIKLNQYTVTLAGAASSLGSPTLLTDLFAAGCLTNAVNGFSGTWTTGTIWNGIMTQSLDDTTFSMAFGPSGGQDRGYLLAAWQSGMGTSNCDVLNTATGTVVNGGSLIGSVPDQWGGTSGAGGTPLPDLGTIHDSYQPLNDTYAIYDSATNQYTQGNVINNNSQYNWQIGTTTSVKVGIQAPNWTASHNYIIGFHINPAAGNAGNYIYQAQGACTSGTSPTWGQTPGVSVVTDNTCSWLNIGLPTASQYNSSGHYWFGYAYTANGKQATTHLFPTPVTPQTNLLAPPSSTVDQHFGSTNGNAGDTNFLWSASGGVGDTTDLLHCTVGCVSGNLPSPYYDEGFFINPPLGPYVGTGTRRVFHPWNSSYSQYFDIQNMVSMVSQDGLVALIPSDDFGAFGPTNPSAACSTAGFSGPACSCNIGAADWNASDGPNLHYGLSFGTGFGQYVSPSASNAGNYVYKIQSCAGGNCTTGAKAPLAITTTTLGAGGTGYVNGNVLSIVQAGASGGTITVTGTSSGVITTYTLTTPGTAYSKANGLTLSGGSGTGATINITGVSWPQASTVAGIGTFVDGTITWGGAPDVLTPANTAVPNCRPELIIAILSKGGGAPAVNSATITGNVKLIGNVQIK